MILQRARWERGLLLGAVLTAAACAPSALAQQDCAQQEFAASSGDVDAALHSLRAYSGERLPTIEGFAASADTPLDRFKRGFYQYKLQLTPAGGGGTKVRVCAVITAWLDSAGASQGYRKLPSNGRLEADLIDRLGETLKTNAGANNPPTGEMTQNAAPGPAETAMPAETPDAGGGTVATNDAGVSKPVAHADLAVPSYSALPSYQSLAATKPLTPVEQKSQQALVTEVHALEQIMNSQTHPQNLVVVREYHSPVLERPSENAKVLLYADAEDEFEKESETANWVHVKIAGLSRGYIRKSQLEETGPAKTGDALPMARKTATQTPVMKEEVSLFPGKWEPLDGKQVEVVSVEPASASAPTFSNKKTLSASVFHKAYREIASNKNDLAGVVIIFDSADGLMAAATKESIQQWEQGQLTSTAFWKQCYLDPKDAFKVTP